MIVFMDIAHRLTVAGAGRRALTDPFVTQYDASVGIPSKDNA